MPEEAPLLLDTHVWIWALEGQGGTIGRGARAAMEGR